MRAIALALMLSTSLPALAAAQVPQAAMAAPTMASPLEADTPFTSRAGTQLTAPLGWTVNDASDQIVVTPPEADGYMALVEIDDAVDAADAAAKAWQIKQPGFARKLLLTTQSPARSGWQGRTVFDYETSPNEELWIEASVLKRPGGWTVSLIHLTEATSAKRSAAVGLYRQSFKPQGYTPETFAGRQVQPLDAARIEQIRSFVETAMAQLGIPGAGLALYDGGQIVYEGGIGVRELGKPEPVDANTLFMIASNTKGMATLLLAKLVDQGRLDWDQKVTDVYPAFRLGDQATTDSVLIKHLVCACTGLPRKDMEWLINTQADTSALDTFTQLAATQPTSGFGEIFQYNNLMASAAGYVGGHIYHPDMELGAAFDRAMQDEIFSPLGMNNTLFDTHKALQKNHASPHGLGLGTTPQVAKMDMNYNIYPFRPAGGAWSSAHDMILYVANEIRQGELSDGHRLMSAPNLLKRREATVPKGENAYYGMGLQVTATWGVPVVHHGGSLFGYKSDIMLIPEAGIGAVILTNSDEGGMLLSPFMRRLLEVIYDGEPEAAADVTSAAERYKLAAKEFAGLLSPANGPAASLAERYSNPDLGQLDIQRTGDDVFFQFVSMGSKMASRTNEDGTISFITTDIPVVGLGLTLEERDGQKVLIMRDSQHEYVFKPVS